MATRTRQEFNQFKSELPSGLSDGELSKLLDDEFNLAAALYCNSFRNSDRELTLHACKWLVAVGFVQALRQKYDPNDRSTLWAWADIVKSSLNKFVAENPDQRNIVYGSGLYTMGPVEQEDFLAITLAEIVPSGPYSNEELICGIALGIIQVGSQPA